MFMMFSGILLQPSNVTWVFRWLSFVSPLRWGLTMFVYLILIKTPDYRGAYFNETLGHFVCPGDATGGHECYGITGKQILTTLSKNYETLTADLDFPRTYCYLLGIVRRAGTEPTRA
jgi:hypothetical protein